MFVCECAYTSAQDLTSLLGFALKSAKAQLVRDFQGYFLPQSKMRFKFWNRVPIMLASFNQKEWSIVNDNTAWENNHVLSSSFLFFS